MHSVKDSQYQNIQIRLETLRAKFPQADGEIYAIQIAVWAFAQPSVPVLGAVS